MCEVDVKNAHPSILLGILEQLAEDTAWTNEVFERQFGAIRHYVDNRAAVLSCIQAAFGVDKKAAKAFFKSATYGQSSHTWARKFVSPEARLCAPENAWKILRSYQRAIKLATTTINSEYGFLAEVARRNRKTKANSVLFHILSSFEATHMLELATFVQAEGGISTAALVHDALFLEGGSQQIKEIVGRYQEATARTKIGRRLLHECSVI